MYLVFGYNRYYPLGGVNDLICIVDTRDEAVQAVLHLDTDDYEIVRIENGRHEVIMDSRFSDIRREQ